MSHSLGGAGVTNFPFSKISVKEVLICLVWVVWITWFESLWYLWDVTVIVMRRHLPNMSVIFKRWLAIWSLGQMKGNKEMDKTVLVATTSTGNAIDKNNCKVKAMEYGCFVKTLFVVGFMFDMLLISGAYISTLNIWHDLIYIVYTIRVYHGINAYMY